MVYLFKVWRIELVKPLLYRDKPSQPTNRTSRTGETGETGGQGETFCDEEGLYFTKNTFIFDQLDSLLIFVNILPFFQKNF